MKTGEYNSRHYVVPITLLATVEKAYNMKLLRNGKILYTDGGSHYVIFDEMKESLVSIWEIDVSQKAEEVSGVAKLN